MLSVSSYDQAYVAKCGSQIDRQMSAYKKLVKAGKDEASSDDTPFTSAIEVFEPLFFNHMVIALDNYFCHRSRNMELKDGNPLNEVRVLCSSLMTNDGVLISDKQIRLDPEKSVLGLRVGDEIGLTEAEFRRLSKAFLAEIENKYP
jgi:hypothetical protein